MAAPPDGLLDSNVLIALLAEASEHHAASIAILVEQGGQRYAVAAHSYARSRGENALKPAKPVRLHGCGGTMPLAG